MTKEAGSLSLSDVYEKERRRRRRVVLFALALLVYGVFLGGAWLVIRSPLFRIQKLEISGNTAVSDDDIRTVVYSALFGDSFWKRVLGVGNILVWPKMFSPDDLKFIPKLKHLSIQKNYETRTVAVTVEERQPFGVWCLQAQTDAERTQTNADNIPRESASSPRSSASDSCWWFDDEGLLFAKALDVEGNLITVVDDYSQKNLGLGAKILSEEFIPNMFSVFKAVSGSGLSVKEIRLNDLELQEVEIDTYSSTGLGASAGPKLYFSLRFPADNALAVIQSLEKQAGFGKFRYLDFRVENRAYYK